MDPRKDKIIAYTMSELPPPVAKAVANLEVHSPPPIASGCDLYFRLLG